MERLPVSVVIPVYNREDTLRRALASVSAQTPLGPAEVIVVDDASTDSSAAVAEEWGARVVRHAENRGAAAARNSGIKLAGQPWVAPLDSDDAWLPHHLATLWTQRGNHVLVAGAALAHGDGGARYAGVPTRRPQPLDSPADVIFPENVVPASGLLARTDALRAVGGYDARLRYAEDFDLVIRLLEYGTGLAIPTVVYHWSRHPGSKSTEPERPRRAHREIVAAFAGRQWWSRRLFDARAAVAEWDDLRQALAEGRRGAALRSALWIGRRPARLRGLAGLLAFRHRVRRRTREVTAGA